MPIAPKTFTLFNPPKKTIYTKAGPFDPPAHLLSAWELSKKRKDRQPDRRTKLGKQYWDGFLDFETQMLAQLGYGDNPPEQYADFPRP